MKSPRLGAVAGIGLLLVVLLSSAAFAAVPPGNDDFDHASVIAAVPFSDHLDTSGATAAADDPTSCSPTNNSVWYSFTPSVNETVTADTFGGGSAAFVSAYTGSRGALTQVACGDINGFSVTATWVATAGITYHLMVASPPFGGGGTIALNVKTSLPPANDDFDHAIVIAAVPFSDHLDTSGATAAADDPTSCSPTNNSVWYSFTPSVNETVTADTFGGGSAAFVSAYTGSRGALTQVACGDINGFTVAATWAATAGVSYHLMVASPPFAGSGTIALNVSAQILPAPVITSPATAPFVVGVKGTFTVTTTGSPTPTLSETGTLPGGLTFMDNRDGTATLTGIPTATGTSAVTVRAHNATGADAIQTLTVIVHRATTATTVSTSPTNPAFGSSITFTATVSPTSPNAFGPSGTVTFYLDNQTSPLADVTLTGGNASFTTSGLGAGTHSLVATYHGDSNFTGSTSAPASVATGIDQTITGTHNGPVIVAKGSTVLLRDADVRGAVIVLPGGALDVENSAVAGTVIAQNPSAIRVCASAVNGGLIVSRATGFVLIGDSGDDSCAPNTIKGALIVPNNAHGLEVIGNQIRGVVIISGNSGNGPFPEDTSPEVADNRR